MGLKEELGLRTGFQSLPHEALLGIYHSASLLKKAAQAFFRAHGLTDVQYNVLALLATQSGDAGGLAQIELSRMMLVNRANITALMDRMEAARLVVRTAVAGDRRFNLIKLSARGRRKYHSVAERYTAEIARIMNVLDDPEQRTLVTLLERIRGRLQEE